MVGLFFRFVGWVERSETHHLPDIMMGIASLHPSYVLRPVQSLRAALQVQAIFLRRPQALFAPSSALPKWNRISCDLSCKDWDRQDAAVAWRSRPAIWRWSWAGFPARAFP